MLAGQFAPVFKDECVELLDSGAFFAEALYRSLNSFL